MYKVHQFCLSMGLQLALCASVHLLLLRLLALWQKSGDLASTDEQRLKLTSKRDHASQQAFLLHLTNTLFYLPMACASRKLLPWLLFRGWASPFFNHYWAETLLQSLLIYCWGCETRFKQVLISFHSTEQKPKWAKISGDLVTAHAALCFSLNLCCYRYKLGDTPLPWLQHTVIQ